MFGVYYYHERIRKSVALFGKLFNDIYIMRKDANNNAMSTIKVPLAYAPKRKYMERLLENADLTQDTKVAVKLPRMSFEIVSMSYDASRQLAKINNISMPASGITSRTKFYAPTPYDVQFQLNIYAKTHDDALQIVEQILPYFAPQYTLTIKPLTDFPTIKEDVPITLTGVTFTDDYEGSMEQRRTIIYTLDFEMKIQFYGPTSSAKIIREANADLYTIGTGPNGTDTYVERITVQPDPLNVSADSDYGFTTIIDLAFDSA